MSTGSCAGEEDVMWHLALLGLRRLASRWQATISLAVLVALPVALLTMVDGYLHAANVRHTVMRDLLVVQQEGTVGQFAGSRLPGTVADDLRALGIDDPIPEIRGVLGATGSDLTLIAGVDVARYRNIEPHRLVAGRHLREGDTERTAVFGRALAGRDSIRPGDVIRMRGRDVHVVGIVENGTFLDDLALLPLADAQALLGWGADVSTFMVPADGPLALGDRLPGGLEVVERGTNTLSTDYEPLADLMVWAVRMLAVGTLLVLVSAVWRLTWLQRRDLALVRILGFRRRGLAAYLGAQYVVLVAGASLAGLAAAVVISPRLARFTLGSSVRARVEAEVLWTAIGRGATLTLVALAVPVVAVGRTALRALMSQED